MVNQSNGFASLFLQESRLPNNISNTMLFISSLYKALLALGAS
jgi:hypothetical protein